MKELKELSANYATEKTNEMMSQIVAQAFADGYRMGYKDREDEIQVDLCDSKTEFVDLGLPSGTLWSADYLNALWNVNIDTRAGNDMQLKNIIARYPSIIGRLRSE